MRSLLALLASLTLVATLGACGTSGGDDEAATTTAAAEEETTTTEAEAEAVAVDEWAAGFCDAFGGWLDDIETASSEISSLSPDDLETAQSAVSELFGTASDVTEDLIAQLEELGAPDIDDGDQLAADLQEKFQGFVDAADAAQAEVDDLELDLTTFESEFDDLIARFQDEVSAVGDSFAEIDAQYPSDDLDAALSESCTF